MPLYHAGGLDRTVVVNGAGEYSVPSGRSCASCARGIRASLHSIASIEDPIAIKKILEHLDRRAEAATPIFRPFARAPPQQELPGLHEAG